MTIRAKKLQIFYNVVLVVSIKMMNLKHQFLPVPISNSTYLTMSIPIQHATNILSFQIHRLNMCPITEYFLVLPINQLPFIMLSISRFREPIIEMRCV